MNVNRPMKIPKKVTSLQFKIGLLFWEVLLPFGLYWSLTTEKRVFSALFSAGILLGIILLVVFG